MIVKFWGVRGTMPTPGPHTVRYGGNTTTVSVEIEGKVLILDAGTGIRALGTALMGTDEEIFFYDGLTTTQLTNNGVHDTSPHISGSSVVWQSGSGSNSEIFLYDGLTTTQLTNNSVEESYARISGDNVVWYGSAGDADSGPETDRIPPRMAGRRHTPRVAMARELVPKLNLCHSQV